MTHWRRLLPRVAGVFGIGVVHSLVIAVLTLRWIMPVFSENGCQLAVWWNHTVPTCAAQPPDLVQPLPAWLLVALATAWSLTSGVFLQSLWQNQPITAPLGHVEWRGGR